MTATFPDAYRQAAQRARVVASIARDRSGPLPTISALSTVAAHLDAAAAHFDAVPPGAYGELPTGACQELSRAGQIAATRPAVRFPVELSEYVLMPLVDRELPFPGRLNLANPQFAQREADLVHMLHLLHTDGTHQRENIASWLHQVFTVWQQHARLTDEAHTAPTRSANQHP